MARNQEVLPLTTAWSQITNSDATSISFQAREGDVEIRRGTTAEPSATDVGWAYREGYGERNLTVADIGATTGARVWARAAGIYNAASILVDHA